MRMVVIAMNSQGYHIHAGAELKHHVPDNNQATPIQYHIPDHNLNMDILVSYGSVVGNI